MIKTVKSLISFFFTYYLIHNTFACKGNTHSASQAIISDGKIAGLSEKDPLHFLMGFWLFMANILSVIHFKFITHVMNEKLYEMKSDAVTMSPIYIETFN